MVPPKQNLSSYSVVVSTRDFESLIDGSNPSTSNIVKKSVIFPNALVFI